MKTLLYVIFLFLLSNCAESSYQKAIIENHTHIANDLRHSAYSRYRPGMGEVILGEVAPGKTEKIILPEVVLFDTFKGQKANHYSFQAANGTLILKKQNTQFQEGVERRNITDYVLNLEKELNTFNIKLYDGEPNILGVLLQLHMNDGSTILYTEDTSLIKDSLALAYIRKAKPLCSNWYYSQEAY